MPLIACSWPNDICKSLSQVALCNGCGDSMCRFHLAKVVGDSTYCFRCAVVLEYEETQQTQTGGTAGSCGLGIVEKMDSEA